MNYFLCKLTVSGSVESMNEFYKVLNSESTEFEKDRFSMNKFYPIPDELLDDYVRSGFKSTSSILNPIVNDEFFVGVDKNERTEDEFRNYVSLVEELYWTTNKEEWCEFNWGCEDDVEVIKEILSCDKEYCVKYYTIESPNTLFVSFLHDNYSGSLDLKLEYVSCEYDVSGTDEFLKKKSIYTTHKCECVLFKEIPGTEMFRFMAFENEDELPANYVDILGGDWVKSLKDDGFTNKNVVNWDELVVSMKDYE